MSEAVRRTVRRAACLSLALLMGVVGCSPEGTPDSAVAPVIVSADDVQIVGTSNAIAHIEDIMPAADGAAWVLTSTEPFLVLLSQEGEELRVTGARGGGPGELSWPTTLARDPATGVVVVYDPALGRLLPADRDDEGASFSLAAAAARPIRLNSYEYLWTNNGGRTWLEGTEGGFVFAEPTPGIGWISSLWTTEVTRLKPDGEIERVVSTADVVGDPSTRFPGAERFLPYPIWTACPDGSLAVYDPNENLVRRLSADGEALRTHELPPERRVEMTAERVFTTVYPGVLRNRLMADPPGRDVLYEAFRRDYTNRASEFSAVFPEYVHLDCSGPDTLWLQAFDTTRGQLGRGPSWLRISADGEIGVVEFPNSFRPMRFDEGRIWGTYTGELDVEYVAWTEVDEL